MALKYSPTVERWLKRGLSLWEADPRSLAELITALSVAGHDKKAIRLAGGMYRPRRASTDPNGPEGPIVGGVETYWVAHTLPRVSAVLSEKAKEWLITLATWVEEYQVLAEYARFDHRDLSPTWRPSISQHEQNHGWELMGNALVDALRDASIAASSDEKGLARTLAVLDRSEQSLLHRIALHVLRSKVASGSTQAITPSTQRILNQTYWDIEYLHEYAELARTTLPKISPEDQQQWVNTLLEGPFISRVDLEARSRLYVRDETDIEAAVSLYRETWRHRYLSAVGPNALPPSARTMLAELDTQRGTLDHPDFPTYMSAGFVGLLARSCGFGPLRST